MAVEAVGGWIAWNALKKTVKSVRDILGRLTAVERKTGKLDKTVKALDYRVGALEEENARQRSENHGLRTKVGIRDAKLKKARRGSSRSHRNEPKALQ
jgi:regulator of replication initiation timing